ncbi:MAG: hypothetical protein ABL956_15325 [Hyphomonadaceae bacterium]
MADGRHLERYFLDPATPVLSVGASGIACANLRQALGRLRFAPAGPDFSDRYDEALAEAVFKLQQHHHHTSHDGKCGPGTRALLATCYPRRSIARPSGAGPIRNAGVRATP